MNWRQLTKQNNMTEWRAYFEALLNYSSDVQNKRVQTQSWHLDMDGQLNVRTYNGPMPDTTRAPLRLQNAAWLRWSGDPI